MSSICNSSALIPIENAINLMFEQLELAGTRLDNENVSLDCALHRILAEDLVASMDVPPTDNSAMDGYAIIASDLVKTDTLEQTGTVLAGSTYNKPLLSGQCVRIMTGAPIPQGADTVIMQEQTEQLDSKVRFLVTKNKGNNIRKRGESIAKGSTILTSGTRLNAAHLGVIASLGVSNIAVVKKMSVGVMATGDELAEQGEPLKEGHIYESNRVMITALLQQLGANVIDYGIVPDTLEDIEKALEQANEKCDVVISSGGVSVGEADFVKQALDNLGDIGFWKVAIKPGKPFAFGRLKDSWFCGLPGNPVSSYITCQQLVLPFLKKIQREFLPSSLTLMATAETDIKKLAGRKDYQRGVFRIDNSGDIFVKTNGAQGSGIMTSVTTANCYIVFESDSNGVLQGDRVKILPFSSVFN